MDFFMSMEFTIPAFQMMLLLLLSTLSLLFGRVKLALMINYIFTIYWGFLCNQDLFIDLISSSDYYVYSYLAFGVSIAFFALVGFLFQKPKQRYKKG